MSDPRLVISVADSTEDLLDARRLRYEIYREQGLIGVRPDGADVDEWDSSSTTLIARRFDGPDPSGPLLGAIRICGEIDGMLPLEHHGFRLPDWFPRSGTRETSRWVARPSRSARTGLGLTIAVYNWLSMHGLTHAVAAVRANSLRALDRGPWEVLRLGRFGPAALDPSHPLSLIPICIPIGASPLPPPAGIVLQLAHGAPVASG